MSTQEPPCSVNEGCDTNVPPLDKKRKGSEVWKHMEKITKKVGDKDILEAASCNYCKKRLKASSDGNGTSSLLRHLQNHCARAPLEAKLIGKGQQLLTLNTEGSLKPYAYKKEVWLDSNLQSRPQMMLKQFQMLTWVFLVLKSI
ncbi:unnamed protein product [Cuscuta epithymum]|uniref:BED-type domain-containing protein n=1 Tax=Cuscuta epithymum TaxID=186058 RepID=A0AAV0CLA0_9ASTE|nr:unnamed protein product [Cuscuta epithymum]